MGVFSDFKKPVIRSYGCAPRVKAKQVERSLEIPDQIIVAGKPELPF